MKRFFNLKGRGQGKASKFFPKSRGLGHDLRAPLNTPLLLGLPVAVGHTTDIVEDANDCDHRDMKCKIMNIIVPILKILY